MLRALDDLVVAMTKAATDPVIITVMLWVLLAIAVLYIVGVFVRYQLLPRD